MAKVLLGDQLVWKFEEGQVRVISVDSRPIGRKERDYGPPVLKDCHLLMDGDSATIVFEPYPDVRQYCHVQYEGGRLWDTTVLEDPVLVWEGGWVRHGLPHVDFGVTFGLRDQ
jgi:hypothetical protein